jgi:hypothetical protein
MNRIRFRSVGAGLAATVSTSTATLYEREEAR